jgi:long-subunit fatty acid transport protein
MQGLVLRVTPAYVSSRETGLPSEPEKGVSLKTKLSYAATSGMMVSGYYNYRDVKNNDRAFTDSTAAGAPAALTTRQDNDRKQQAAGVTLNMPFGEAIKATASLSWMQDDFTSYFLRSNRRRYEGTQNVIFANFDRSNYDIDTYVFSLGGDWQVSSPLRLNAGYVWSRSKGQTGSGFIQDELSAGGRIDGAIDSAIHSLALGVDYRMDKSIKLKGSYAYDSYKDKVYSSLTGGYHTLMLGVSFGF